MSRFLLVSLNIDAVLQESTIHRRRQKLNAMTDGLGLGDAYGATLGRIKKQGGDKARLGMDALMWISHAERPLKADELCHALSVEIASPNLNTDNVPSISTLLACCQGLVAVEKEASTVRLIHFTLQEYLLAHSDLFDAAHSTMAETCLSYLNSQQVKAFSTSPSPDLQGTPFLNYSSLYWGVHAKRDLSGCAKRLALKLFDDYNRHISIKILSEAHKVWGFDAEKVSGFSGLHCVSLFGIVEIMVGFAEIEDCDINQTDFSRSTPLHWAARNGQEGAVETLLGLDGIIPDKPDINGEIPLHVAANCGHEGVVKILLGQGLNPDIPNLNDQTPFFLACREGQEGMVKMLLEQGGVNPDKPDILGRTPLYLAAEHGNDGVVKILLGRDDVNPDKPNNKGQTPLLAAAGHGREGIVKMLLERDEISPDTPDTMGRTPFWWAACLGQEGVVKILLEREDIDHDKPNIYGRTPLNRAAGNGHEGVVKILLGRDDINPNTIDKDGKTPLDSATEEGYRGIIALLQPPESATLRLP